MAILVLLAGVASAVGYGPAGLIGSSERGPTAKFSTYTARPSELLVTVTEDGNVESAANIDIKCQVSGGSSILWIINDGTEVKEGDKLVELDSSTIENEMNTQRITYNKAKAAVIQAQKNFEVAKISVKEYLEGTYLQELEAAETQITIAEENLRSAQNALEYAERMFQRGYISQLELESQQFSVKRAELELNSARTAKKVLEEFTRAKTVEDLQSQVETAEAAMESEQAAFELEEAKLRRLEQQIANCVIYAPQDGMVVYANERGGRFGQEGSTVEEGAAVRDRQTILRLPDLSQMQVKVTVHETKVDSLRPGLPARIKIQGREFPGSLVSIANQPEATNWFQGNVKEYAAIVRIEGNPEGLRPGMTAEVEVLVAHKKDVISVPVSTVVELRDGFFCWIINPDGEIERRKVLLGMTNDQYVEVVDGIAEGDRVIRNPRAIIEEAREDSASSDAATGEPRFGNAEVPSPAGEEGPGRDGAGSGSPGQGPPVQGPPGQVPPDGRSGERGARDREPGGPGGPPGGGQRRGGPGGFDLMQFDKDGDEKVSKEEAPERMQDFFDRLDESGDGFIDKEEADAMRSRFPRGRPQE